MNTLTTSRSKNRHHLVMIAAAIAVILFCAAGTAAILGWIPASNGSNAENVTARQDQLTSPAKAPAGSKPRFAAATPSNALCGSCGIVESTREITTRGEGSGVGAAGGAVVGGLLGNQVGGGSGKDIMTVVGAVGGAVVGNQIEGRVKATRSYEITVRMADGSSRAIQQADQPGWHSGDRVKIIDGVVRADT